ncbi:MAG: leucine-rich repeat domain-containing protein [Clostridia bacterium]|nr:leucine-rich repeat domain-containing protein [Clostridia bacterium]
MKPEEMFKALDGIKEEYLNDAFSCGAPKKRTPAKILQILIPVAAMIATLSLILVAALPMLVPPENSEYEDPVPPLEDPPEQSYEQSGIIYHKYKDHAVITQIEGNGEVARVPEIIDNVPVTKVELTDSTPKNYKTLSFNGVYLESLTLPQGQKLILEIGKDVLKIKSSALESSSLIAVSVDQNNKKYASFGGMLYSKDFSELIACPAGTSTEKFYSDGTVGTPTKEESVTGLIAAQTTKIANSAFKNCASLVDITLPEGLTSIGELAFENCPRLRSMTLPTSLKKIAENAIKSCAHLGYVYYSGTPADFENLKIDMPIGAKVFYPLSASDEDLDTETLIAFFEKAEEHYAWFSRFNFIPCDSAESIDGYYPVTVKGLETLEDLRVFMEKEFDSPIVERLFKKYVDCETPLFTEINGTLHMLPQNIPVFYDLGKREYSFSKNSDGSISLRLRTVLTETSARICIDTDYTIVQDENGYRFIGSFLLPAEAWYPLYLIESY